MVGGTVVGVVRRGSDVLLNVEDTRPGYRDQRTIRCVADRRDGGGVADIQPGDAAWVQGRDVMWTPRGADFSGATPRVGPDGRQTYDIELPRVF